MSATINIRKRIWTKKKTKENRAKTQKNEILKDRQKTNVVCVELMMFKMQWTTHLAFDHKSGKTSKRIYIHQKLPKYIQYRNQICSSRIEFEVNAKWRWARFINCSHCRCNKSKGCIFRTRSLINYMNSQKTTTTTTENHMIYCEKRTYSFFMGLNRFQETRRTSYTFHAMFSSMN